MSAAHDVYWSETDVEVDEEWALELGKQLAELRDEKGLSQDKMAALLGVGRRTIVKYETGNGGRLAFFVQYCDALGSDLALISLRARAAIKTRNITAADLDELGEELLKSGGR